VTSRVRNPMHVIFIHGPAASGKHTIGSELSQLTKLPLFHNHLAVDAAKALFSFGSPAFNAMRAQIWRTAFREAAAERISFIFTFHPEATVEPPLIDELVESVCEVGGRVHFVALTCAPTTVLRRIGEPSRASFGKLTDAALYRQLESQGAFAFPNLPAALLTINTDEHTADESAQKIEDAVRIANRDG